MSATDLVGKVAGKLITLERLEQENEALRQIIREAIARAEWLDGGLERKERQDVIDRMRAAIDE